MTDKPKFVYVTYIASTPEKVWQALVKPDMTEKYWFGYRVAADGKLGDHMTARIPAGKRSHRDLIIESDPPRRLSMPGNRLERQIRRKTVARDLRT